MEKSLERKNAFTPLIKGSFVALCFSLVAILLFAVALRFFDISGVAIKIVNQIIKVVSVFFGVFSIVKKDRSKGLLRGALVGVLYTLISYFIFSILIQSFVFSASLIYDLLFSAIVGIICGVFLVNLKKAR